MKYLSASVLIVSLLGAALAGCEERGGNVEDVVAGREQETHRFNEFLARAWEERLTASPELRPSPDSGADYDKWDDPSAEASDERQYQIRLQLAELLKFDYTRLEPAERLSYELFEEESNRRIEQYRWRSHHALVKQQGGSPAALEPGVWRLPNGDQFYRALVRWYTTADLTPDELHEIGLQEVPRVLAEMTALMPGLGFDGTLPELFAFRNRIAAHTAVPDSGPPPAPAWVVDGLPEFRKRFPATAFTAGWTLYAGRLARERAEHADPEAEYRRLAVELEQAVRLVVDTGIHAKRWTREQAVQYVTEQLPLSRVAAQQAVERSVAEPGRATAATVGLLRLVELRERVAAELKEQFDSREFHEVVLSNGPVSVSTLQRVINRYIEAKVKR